MSADGILKTRSAVLRSQVEAITLEALQRLVKMMMVHSHAGFYFISCDCAVHCHAAYLCCHGC